MSATSRMDHISLFGKVKDLKGVAALWDTNKTVFLFAILYVVNVHILIIYPMPNSPQEEVKLPSR
jgi:zona occludens toxin (predicted ATPase)